MASVNRASAKVVTTETHVARLLRERHQLSVPVDVHDLLGREADVEFTMIPNQVDGLIVDLHRTVSERPKVLIQQGRPLTRQRFTMAHELGHLNLGWHLGVTGCHVSYSHDDSTATGNEETEANRFASELLMPTEYLRAVASTGATLEVAIEQIAEEAQVSGIAAVIAAAREFDRGWVWACVERDDRIVVHSGESPHTGLQSAKKGTVLDWTRRSKIADFYGAVEIGAYAFEVLHYATKNAPSVERPKGDLRMVAKELVKEMGKAVPGDKAEVLASKHILSGETSDAAKRHPNDDPAELVARMRARCGARDELTAYLTHPLFDEYLNVRAHYLLDRKSGGA